ncbi:MAG TPA: SbcC/MukB-like Walker B domain-containing protein, partial [Kofleriaceae bacterium]|nr:SbcC/MukB-like Walker B domain-containing protein [Kofleriaceae bacterium]
EGASSAGLAGLEGRLAALRRARDAAATERDRHHREQILREDERERARREADEAAAHAGEIAGRLAEAAAAVRRMLPGLPDDDAVAHHVRVQQRGDSFRSTEAVRERIQECERREVELCAELSGDGSRGVRYLAFAAQFGFAYDPVDNRLFDRRDQPAAGIMADLDRTLAEQRELSGERTRDLMERLVVGSLARDLQGQVEALHGTVREINRLLAGLRFGSTEYQLVVTPRPERRELVELVRSLSLLDEDSRRGFRGWIEDRLADLRAAEDGVVPEVLDYRAWFDVRIRVRSGGGDGVDLTRPLRLLGSGGEQGVPNYLIVFALAKLLFDSIGAAVRPLLFDEAFYGIDAGRRDQLLRFATECGLQIAVASPDQDGATPAVRNATTLFVVKDDEGDVHLFPYHYWNRSGAQGSLLDEGDKGNAPENAACGAAEP